MRVGSLFSGIGGIELGLERAGGFETAWFIENEPHAQAILRKHWPTAKIYEDITTVDWRTIQSVDVLTGGFPCQDISNAGKRAGITGRRSSLWKYYLEAIRILRPQVIIAENVAALIDRGLDVVLADLASVGYDAEWHCIPASSVGAPHRRDRVFIIAYPDSERGCESQQKFTQGHEGQPQHETCGRSAIISNTHVKRLERQRLQRRTTGKTESLWTSEPDMVRVAHGIPLWMDRIKRLGNAVVPQVAEAIGRAIKEVMLRENR